MGHRELIESLRIAADGKVRTLRDETETEAGRLRAETALKIDELHRARQAAAAARTTVQAELLVADARSRARLIKRGAERMLATRLHALARSLLASLRNVGYADVFGSFVKELPPLMWKSVRINPSDLELAREHFPDAEIGTDPAISGGFIAASEGGKITVTNTFEKRLERIWEELCPMLILDAQGKGNGNH
ncbi:MAG: V-type ATP synthase subunit E [Nitrospiraceae bacterium]|nr:V-type ATP synthase subunit E [Nitrospiraceae bacterium]